MNTQSLVGLVLVTAAVVDAISIRWIIAPRLKEPTRTYVTLAGLLGSLLIGIFGFAFWCGWIGVG